MAKILIFLACILPCSAQQIDSLERLLHVRLKTGELTDTVPCALLLKLKEAAPDESSGMAYNAQLLRLSGERLRHPSVKGRLSRMYKRYHAAAVNSLGCYYLRQGELEPAINEMNKAIALFREINDSARLAQSLANASSIYFNLGDVTQALEYNNQSLKIFGAIGNKQGIANSYNTLATSYHRQNDMDRALFYYNMAYEIYAQLKDSGRIANYFNILGEIHLLKKDYDQALRHHYRAMDIYQGIKDHWGLSKVMNDIGYVFMNKGDVARAPDFFKKSLAIREQINDKEGVANSLSFLGHFYLEQNNNRLALDYSLRALRISQEIGYPISIAFAADVLREAYKRAKLYSKALEVTELWQAMRDSVSNQNNQQETIRKQIQYEFEKKEILLREEQKKAAALAEQTRKYYMIIAVILVCSLIGAFVLLYMRFRHKKKDEQRKLELQLKDAEIVALQAQMNPHFVFNALNSILEVVRKGNQDEAMAYLTKFSKLIRIVLEAATKRAHTLGEEMEVLKLYIDLENLRLQNIIHYTIHAEGDLDPDDIEIPVLILQPYIENAILHGIQNKLKEAADKGEQYFPALSVSFRGQAGLLYCIVEDNGIGRARADEIKRARGARHFSTGMRITKDRLSLLTMNKYSIEVSDLMGPDNKPAGTRVKIELPLNELF